jgi:hypothetical protein
LFTYHACPYPKGSEGKEVKVTGVQGREGKGREGKGREGKGREGKKVK